MDVNFELCYYIINITNNKGVEHYWDSLKKHSKATTGD